MSLLGVNSAGVIEELVNKYIVDFQCVTEYGAPEVLRASLDKSDDYVSIPISSDPELKNMVFDYWIENKASILSN